MTERNPREVALDILMSVMKDGVPCHIAMRTALDDNMNLTRQDRAFIRRLAEGTIERKTELDYIIGQYSNVSVGRMKPVIVNILRSAVYQLLYMDEVPDSAAVDEAVKLAQKRGFYSLKGFVNGVLRNIDRNKADISYPPEDTDEYLSVRYSMPLWIVRLFIGAYSRPVTVRILKSFLENRPLTVRMSEDEDVRAGTVESLLAQGVRVTRAPYLPYAYNLSGVRYLPALRAFKSGLIYPQDVSSMLVAEAAAPKKGDYVIDMCAAPGGKSLHIASKMHGYGMVEARDLTDEKVGMIRENIARFGAINIRAVRMDATVFDPASENRADIVLADVPCSGLGVIGRKPDIKYRVTPESIDSLLILQRSILHSAAAYVCPGGILLYSTCTLNPAENIGNVRWFEEHYPFRLESLNPYLPRELMRLTTEEGYLQIIPGVHRADGFFIARLRKEE